MLLLLLLLLLQTLIGFGCNVTMLYRQATLNTTFLLGSVLVSHWTKVHPVPCERDAVLMVLLIPFLPFLANKLK